MQMIITRAVQGNAGQVHRRHGACVDSGMKQQALAWPLTKIYRNGHDRLARKLTARGIEHTQIDNAFARIEEVPRG